MAAHAHDPAHDHDHDHGHDHDHAHGDDHGHDATEVDVSELGQFGFEAFGVELMLIAPVAVMPRIGRILPPGWKARDATDDDERFVLRTRDTAVYRVEGPNATVSGSSDLQIALEVLDARLRNHIALHAPDHIFVHAGVVGLEGRAIVLPGLSFSGKTTLVAELVRAGATYYSDEFAVLDTDGLVHPYPKPLSMRSNGASQVDHDIGTLGGTVGEEPLPVGLVAIAQYAPNATWDPARLSAGEAMLAVLSNTVPAQERPGESLSAVRRAIEGAVVLQGERGEAAGVARDLLAQVNSAL